MKTPTRSIKSPQTLPVPDAETLDEFLKKAKQVWVQAHPLGSKRGRPSQMKETFTVLYEADDKGLVGKTPTQGKLLKILQDHFGGDHEQRAKRERGLRKYVKIWKLLNRIPIDKRTDQEKEWLANQFPRAQKLTIKWHEILLDEKKWNVGHDGARRTLSSGDFMQISPLIEEAQEELRKIDPPPTYQGKRPEMNLLFDIQSDFLDLFKDRPRHKSNRN